MMVAIIGMAVANICIILYCAALRKELTEMEEDLAQLWEKQYEINLKITDNLKKQSELNQIILDILEQINGRGNSREEEKETEETRQEP